ncbi:GRRM system radical SAM/SPASM domain protein [Rhizobium leguminosarum bv. viciae]|uniref:cyclophane-forming radical SAM/SPASM peptide maturase GrrM/OscB n=1 Tax=Rhizobium ruizarguesonis TaxID=2081791 RepID=UPI00103EE5F2|nr:cyclophane-forming radical SAM/SPASM peptide maturase GrrM/OscB [Rhizobium ruizarguesonis]MBY5806084.1 GRRM system radical SAM/SPASM domain protein [Rhizobium leguminosarum]TBY53403.1 GRRM system radical SAM/SPASM domain protein [Rhizobium leguminosarum bv. viciae]MBY5846878.1 GRRM system radical SAM/SPASM domain protein [Rhizobium leguminosarum]NEH87951.1 GRRM system radical SAM/SPASM domain protein [Rhizobium ruizarguesonis]NEJ58090.1 GRRM system radical SAM/SPASM domain protein [Rhizobiu
MQPTAFCNINCEYCYLPHRNNREVMSIETVRRAADFVFGAGLNAPDFTVVWHAGEPLMVRPEWYRQAILATQQAAPVGVSVPHAIQTNGMLINDEWCDLFIETGMRVGVSLDGTSRLHDARRKGRSGQGTHAQVMLGIDFLRRRGVPFHIICVVGRATLDVADELMDFFEKEEIHNVGFNIEEIEGQVETSTLEQPGTDAAFRKFFARAIEKGRDAAFPILIREREELLACLRSPAFGYFRYNSQNAPFGIVTISVKGDIFTFSPELAGLGHAAFGDFCIGNLADDTLAGILASPKFCQMRRDIDAGISKCRDTCAYFDLCIGGAPANKLFENKSFDSAETMFCRLAHQAVADVVLAEIERDNRSR